MGVTIPHNFVARDYQVPFLKEIARAMRGESEKRFFYQIWHRRAGKDKTNIADVVPRRLIKDPVQVKYVYPTNVMGRGHMWEALDKDGFKFTNHIPEDIRDGDANESRMIIKVKNQVDPLTPSQFQVIGANEPDRLRGGGSKLFIFSEWADHDPYSYEVIEPILRENDGIAVFNTTPKGDNHARSLFEFAKNHPKWYVETLSVDKTGVFNKKQMEAIVDDAIRRFEADGRSKEEALAYIEQEYYVSFDSPVMGAYYGVAMMKAEKEGRITRVPFVEGIPVHTYWDLGIDDSMTIWFQQTIGQEIHFIDYIENSGEGLSYYAKQLQLKPYIYGRHYGPHDIKVRELGTGKSRWEIAKKLGIHFQVAPQLKVNEGINAVRSLLGQCWFDTKNCNRGIQAMKNYRKDWDEKNMVYRKGPKHDWSSHGADGMRTFGVSYRRPQQGQPQQQSGGVKPYHENLPG